MARGDSDLEDLSQTVGACPTCRSVRYRATDAGAWVCEHGHESQSIWTQDAADDGPDEREAGAGRVVRRQLSQGRRRRSARLAVAPAASENAQTPVDAVVGDRRAYAVLLALQCLLRAQLSRVCAVWPGIVSAVAACSSAQRAESADPRPSGPRRPVPEANTHSDADSGSEIDLSFESQADGGYAQPAEAESSSSVPHTLNMRCRTLWLALVSSVAVNVEFLDEDEGDSQRAGPDNESAAGASHVITSIHPRHVLALLFLALAGEGVPVLLADVHRLVAARLLPYNDVGPYGPAAQRPHAEAVDADALADMAVRHVLSGAPDASLGPEGTPGSQALTGLSLTQDSLAPTIGASAAGDIGAGAHRAGADAWVLAPGLLEALWQCGYRGLARHGVPPALSGLATVVHDVCAALIPRLGSEAFVLPNAMPIVLRVCAEVDLPPAFAAIAHHVLSIAAPLSFAGRSDAFALVAAAVFATACVLYDLGARKHETRLISDAEAMRTRADRPPPGGLPTISALASLWRARLSAAAPIAAAALGACGSEELFRGASAVLDSSRGASLSWAAAREAVAAHSACLSGMLDPATLLGASVPPLALCDGSVAAAVAAAPATEPAVRRLVHDVYARPGTRLAEHHVLSRLPAMQHALLVLLALATGVPPAETVRLSWRVFSLP